MAALIYILEDDPECSAYVMDWLQAAGHTVKTFVRPHEFFYALSKQPPQCAVVDWRLPEMQGIDVVSRLRQLMSGAVGVLMLTSVDSEDSVVRALSAGADDYIVKPGSESLLVARVGALLRRLTPSESRNLVVERPPYKLDFARRVISIEGRELDTAPREFELAWAFFSEPARLFTKQELLAAIWGKQQDAGEQTVAQHVYLVRRKLALAENGFKLISVYGAGYRLEVPRP